MTQNRSYGTLCFLFLFTLFWKYFLLSKRNFPIFGIFIFFIRDFFFNAVILQSLSHVWFFVAPWTTACQIPLSSTISQSVVKFMSIESVVLSNYLILCCPLFLLPWIFPSLRVFFQWVSSSPQVGKVLELQLQQQTIYWIFRVDFL